MTRTQQIIEAIDRRGLVTWQQAVGVAIAIAGPAAAEALIAEMLNAHQLCRCGKYLEVA